MTAARPHLWVCFAEPPETVPADVLVLSFLPPGIEERWARTLGDRLLRGRDVLQDVRPRARRAYLDLVVRIGNTPCVRGRTLRQALRGADGVSRWWFLKPSERDCTWDGDPTYSVLLRLLTVRAVAEKYHISAMTLHGASRAVEEALGVAKPARLRHGATAAMAVVRGLTARLRLIAQGLHRRWLYRRLPSVEATSCDVLLEAHWDWSLGPEPDGAGGLRERYFGDLPQRLRAQGARVAWLASTEPAVELWQRGRPLSRVIGAVRGHRDVVLLERFLSLRDVVFTALDIRCAVVVAAFMRVPAFRALFIVDDLDLYPLMRGMLIDSACGAGVARCEQLLVGTRRACGALRPRILVTFLEMFLHARALYAGARQGAPGLAIWAAQHAAYCSDKVFGILDPRADLAGEPDGCPMPAPDGIFAMGSLSRGLWRDDGFDERHLVIAGGLRYQDTTVVTRPRKTRHGTSVLLVASMNTEADIDMCDAFASAAHGVAEVRLRLRDHPQHCLSERSEFEGFRGVIEVTRGSMDAALADADLVCFTYSSLAEDAFVRGIPIWQWLWPGFNGSVFVDLPVIPAFTSVAALRTALTAFVANAASYQPTRETQEDVARQCFGPDPASAARRIADHLVARLREAGR